jgi:hypothetical protein
MGGAGGSAGAAAAKTPDAQIASAAMGLKRVRNIDHASSVSIQGSRPEDGQRRNEIFTGPLIKAFPVTSG